MTPIEVFRGENPEELTAKFNGEEAEGWEPIQNGFFSTQSRKHQNQVRKTTMGQTRK